MNANKNRQMYVAFYNINNTEWSAFSVLVQMVKNLAGKCGKDHVGISLGHKDKHGELHLDPFDGSAWAGRNAGFSNVVHDAKCNNFNCSDIFAITITESQYQALYFMFQQENKEDVDLSYPSTLKIMYDYLVYTVNKVTCRYPLNVDSESEQNHGIYTIKEQGQCTCSQLVLEKLLDIIQQKITDTNIANKRVKTHINVLKRLLLRKSSLLPYDIWECICKFKRDTTEQNVYTKVEDVTVVGGDTCTVPIASLMLQQPHVAVAIFNPYPCRI